MDQQRAIFFDASGVIFTNGTAVFIEKLVKEGLGNAHDLNALLGGDQSWALRLGEIDSETFWTTIKKDIESLTNLPIEELRPQWIDSFTPHEGIEQLMEELRHKGFRLGIIAETTKERAEVLEKRYPGTANVDWKFYSFAVGKDKRDGSLFQFAYQKAALFASSPLMIEDEKASAKRAQEAGFKSFLYKDTEVLRKKLFNT